MNQVSFSSGPRSTERLICLALALAVGLAYAYAPWCGFLNLDDAPYVVLNAHIQHGTLFERVVWAFTAFYSSNWHPLTWLSHGLDVALFGLDPAGHHLTNVLFHAANTLVLFLMLARLTGSLWRSAAVAALFGLHPLQVESVVWVASRKGLLSALFGFLALWAYGAYARRPSWRAYVLVLALLALSLMSKQAFVVFPFLALLLDFWPLDRTSAAQPPGRGVAVLLLEKAPMLALAAAAAWITVLAQRQSGAVAPLEAWGLGDRLAYGLAGYANYLTKALYPIDLAVLYPLKRQLPIAAAVAGGALLTAGSLAAWRFRRTAPWLLTGWLWFVGALVPVIGIVQIGKQATADRYMYLPLVGLAIIVCWGMPTLLRRVPWAARGLQVATLCLLVALAFSTHSQTRLWRDGPTLFGHAIAVTTDNTFMEFNLALVLYERGNYTDAERHFREALRIHPGFLSAHVWLAFTQFADKRYADVVTTCNAALDRSLNIFPPRFCV